MNLLIYARNLKNIEDIALGIGSDNRIGGRFLRAGPAYGG